MTNWDNVISGIVVVALVICATTCTMYDRKLLHDERVVESGHG